VRVPLFDPRAQYLRVKDEIDSAIAGVLESGHYILGEEVAAFEEEVAAFLAVDHAVGVASGTDALVLALLAVGVGPGDEVVVPAFTFIATAEAVVRVGATPVFVDVEDATACLDPAAFEAACSETTRAVLPVHLYGHPCNMDAITSVSAARGIKVIEDNAQGLGAVYRGKRAGAIGDVACMSFFPTKTLGGLGDGGMITTPHAEVAEQVRVLREHGSRDKQGPTVSGFNSRLDPLQAAPLRVKLRHAEEDHDRRRVLAARLSDRLGLLDVRLPGDAEGAEHTYGLYVIRAGGRDAVRARLQDAGISTGVYYPRPLPNEDIFAKGHHPGEFPVAERLSSEVLAVPLFSAMSDEDCDVVADAVESALP
jgi:dTDP-4-amino-4,6-dideoxygalactose transaminase